MKQYLIPHEGAFYKANMHMHTTVSDGKMTPEETKAFFLEKGYSIVAFTDHEALLPHNDLTDDKFLAITAVEASINDDWPGGHVHNRCYHLNLYAKNPNAVSYPVYDARYIWPDHAINFVSEECAAVKYKRHYSIDGINDLIKKARDAGFFVSYNHPVWSLQRYPDYAGLTGLWGVEIHNSGCNRIGYNESTQALDDLLHLNENVFPLATDDAHCIDDCAHGWIQVKAEKLEYDTVIAALENGDFYASTGPEIHELYIEDGIVHLSCSHARQIFLRTERRYARMIRNSSEAHFDINGFITASENEPAMRYRPWFRLEIFDESGASAVTRAYYVDELKKS